ncbi:CD225/dispanin family protein [Amycolatopsis australiensis]|uniref:Interferon-induced transmembrane protein n=1 Tax=Amycolatopsis australiensis TaxID=546364 RepID=A0A1K1RPV9_9PSEU|nr:CD225/dispanin family protein [Amycolatopsis australiensis]SFW74315.1 Interferon-induced transmembrane protein [Amycolatopsis australiensis]
MTDQYPPPYPPPGGPPPGYGYGYPPPNYGPPPDNNMVWAILSTVLCCLPLGVVSIVKSSQVSSLWFQGFHAEAQKAADDARKWAMWSAITTGALLLLYIIFIVVMVVVVGANAGRFTP